MRRTLVASAVALLTIVASVSPVGATAPDQFAFETRQLFAFFSSLPPGQLGTADFVQVLAGTVTVTDNGVVTDETEFLSLAVGQVAIGEGGDVSTIWGGGYQGTNAHVVASPRDLAAEGTLTWTCFVGACPVMPSTVTVEVVTAAYGAPTTSVENNALPGDGGRTHVASQQYRATASVDTGDVLTLPSYVEPVLLHRTSLAVVK